MHATIQYSPETKENFYKPGPGTYDGNSIKLKKSDPAYKLGSATRLDLATSKQQLF